MRRSILACGLLLAFAGISAAAAAASTISFNGNENVAVAGASSPQPAPPQPASPQPASPQPADAHANSRAVAYWRRHVRLFRAGTRHWLTIIRARPLQRDFGQGARTLAVHSVDRLRHLSLFWRHRERLAFRRAHHPPLFGAWLCIHHYEGSWQDAGGPYYGGLQMDLSFQETYGGWLLRTKGTANHWTPLEQIWVAVHAWRSRGFSPWPNTAHYCGVY